MGFVNNRSRRSAGLTEQAAAGDEIARKSGMLAGDAMGPSAGPIINSAIPGRTGPASSKRTRPGHTPSTLMRSPHDLHGAFDMTPFARFLGLALALARKRVLGSLGNGRRA